MNHNRKYATIALIVVCVFLIAYFREIQQIFLQFNKDRNIHNGKQQGADDRVKVHKNWPGITLEGENGALREFVDPLDNRALGMSNKPKSIDEMTEAGAEERFYQLVTAHHLQCADMRRMGNLADGGWDICISGPYKPKQGCIVYSFGINYDFSFDDAIGKTYGCQVKSYDPSMKNSDHKHSKHVFFYKIGLGKANGIQNGWKMMNFASILKQHGQVDKIIDYFKMDIEHGEWDALEDMLQKGSLKLVKQISFEIHKNEAKNKSPVRFQYLKFYNILLSLEKQGFRRYHHHFNMACRYASKQTGKERTFCHELYYVNINFLKD